MLKSENPNPVRPTRSFLDRRRGPSDRELLTTAKAVLITSRGYSDAQAFDELLDVARRHHLSVQGAARCLIDLTSNTRHLTSRRPGTFPEWEGLRGQPPSGPHRPSQRMASLHGRNHPHLATQIRP
ncbi:MULTISPECIES: ANTAR domain-containing protein [unclassified Rhodococcus (in: high G+C Gram-positive bacteria)]|uniref:ANTAR domain-containing protein n=1 Tax=unclassified Rhodococcus (in: high G+C Gram-positive bacteria) TaxID=192944 RepID=UPI000271E49B|nr:MULTISPECIES: ANTAR domain-containing protein [unclassified Rhodococcus (in: high G+C Gram-positive bacteria)]EJJ01747.1 ANTAR domain protein [Rhodococcus sp. JVH1]MDI9949270.1 ANTAR domain-containing protein [Rhodococcus sp. IEGM 1305]